MSEQRRIIKVGEEKYDVTDWTQGDIDQLFADNKKRAEELAELAHAGREYERQKLGGQTMRRKR